MSWQTIDRPGYFGKQRDQKETEFNRLYGPANWRLAWQVGQVVTDKMGVLLLYEDAYYFLFLQQPEILDRLVKAAEDIYDDAPSNVQAGLDYDHQESTVNHLHDIAIRRALLRHGRAFESREVIQIRHTQSAHPLSVPLSPGAVPFHRPDLIVQPQLERWWWQPNSVESFYQSNKVLQIRA